MSDVFEFYTPVIPNPYHDKRVAIADFNYTNSLVLMRLRDGISPTGRRKCDYIVAEPYTVTYRLRYESAVRNLTVPKGMLTDLTSVPRFGRSIVGVVGRHLEAAIVHDFLFIAWTHVKGRGARDDDFRFANDLMSAAMRKARVGDVERAAINGSIRFPFVAWSIYKDPGTVSEQFVKILDDQVTALTGLEGDPVFAMV